MRKIKWLFFLLLVSNLTFGQSKADEDSIKAIIESAYIGGIHNGGPIEEIKKGFHDRFRDHAMQIMKKYNFKIYSIWESKLEKKIEFVYLLEWSDKVTMEKAWEQFRADKEWIEIKKQTSAKFGDLIGNIEDWVLTKMDYSPY